MTKFRMVAALSVLGLAACQSYAPHLAPQLPPQTGAEEQPLPAGAGYRIDEREAAEIPVRVLQQVNLLRSNIGLSPLTLNPQLTAAALMHSRDMSAQNRAWHWGSDGSSPLDRARRQGYYGKLLGENISESYETDLQTLSAWMSTRETRDVIMDSSARDLGFAWYQEPSGKVWWTLLSGG
ncbi:CAP domain-containing protein [Paracoccus siganidrum]|uniref:CAP domain-containing protein n=1 Tax=Paracoccus siganidrum TaxID=1276757 RepID=A0A419AB07_9RHOB|nr:CAP domain-containing protein [Paracoccus siganidrum]RJL20451.1 CAP domain-containing protein [Paracoccus siganidrum]RMC39242.1 CAP domain-containing protein [Paracoccus siganidrum]